MTTKKKATQTRREKTVPEKAKQAPKKPNILFIMADDIGWFNVSCYNHGIMGYRTPNIDRIAKGVGGVYLPRKATLRVTLTLVVNFIRVENHRTRLHH